MAKPPAGSSLLFGALAESGRIKQRKNGSYRMVLKGVDEIDWFTDRPDRVAGEWSPKKLVKKWDSLFGGFEPNAQATFEVGSKKKLVTFEMFKPKLRDSNQTLIFKVRGIGEKNKDLLTGLKNKQISDASLFIDESLPACLPNCKGADLSRLDLSNANLSFANLAGVDIFLAKLKGANLNVASLTGAKLNHANLINAKLNGANLTNAELKDARLTNAELLYTKLTNAKMTKSMLSNADLTYADLTNANLSGAWMVGAVLEGANLIQTDLTDAMLRGANLSGADLSGAKLNGAKLSPITWNDTTCPDGTKNDGTSPCTAEQLNLA